LIKTGTLERNLENEKEQLDWKMDAHLRKKGWESTSSTPGCLWLWRKEISGKIYLVNKASAVHMQAWLDEYGDDE
jgi:hypothetical protein